MVHNLLWTTSQKLVECMKWWILHLSFIVFHLLVIRLLFLFYSSVYFYIKCRTTVQERTDGPYTAEAVNKCRNKWWHELTKQRWTMRSCHQMAPALRRLPMDKRRYLDLRDQMRQMNSLRHTGSGLTSATGVQMAVGASTVTRQ